MKKKLLITGASGFLGGLLAQALKNEHDTAITYNSHFFQLEGCEAFAMDLRRPESVSSVVDAFQPEAVVHCAAEPRGNLCETHSDWAEQINVMGTRRLLEALAERPILFIYISTDLIFDGSKSMYTEADTPQPVSVYGRTKFLAEETVRALSANFIILRPALMYGPAAPSGKGSFVQWMERGFREDEKINLFADEYRTPLFALDAAEAVRRVLRLAPKNRVFNLGGPNRVTRVAFGRKMAELCGFDARKIHPTRLGEIDTGYPRPADVSMDSSRIQQELGMPLTSIEDGLRQIYPTA